MFIVIGSQLFTWGVLVVCINPQIFSSLVPPSKPKKIARVLHWLCCGVEPDRFRAERFHDHVLNSTVSDLRNGYGIGIESTPKTVPGAFGDRTRCVFYTLKNTPENLDLCYQLLTKRWGYRYSPEPPQGELFASAA